MLFETDLHVSFNIDMIKLSPKRMNYEFGIGVKYLYKSGF